MSPSRRTFLAGSVASLALLSGCVSDPSSSGDSPTRTTTETEPMAFGETYDGDVLSITPRSATVQHSFLHVYQTDWAAIKSKAGRQFVFADLDFESAEDGRSSAADFVLEANGEHFRGWSEFDRRSPRWASGFGFDVPAPLDTDDATLIYAPEDENGPTPSWTLPSETLNALRAEPPSFELRDFNAPSEVSAGEEIVIAFTVENAGGDGMFQASLNEGTNVYGWNIVSFSLPGGESRRVERRFDAPTGGGIHYFYDLQSVAGERDAEVVIRPSND